MLGTLGGGIGHSPQPVGYILTTLDNYQAPYCICIQLGLPPYFFNLNLAPLETFCDYSTGMSTCTYIHTYICMVKKAFLLDGILFCLLFEPVMGRGCTLSP